jgi:TPR repeat protein
MEYCAREGIPMHGTSVSALAWWRLAAQRGSRDAMISCADVLTDMATGPTDQTSGNKWEAVVWLQRAVITDDGMTDAQRKTNLIACTYELLERIGRLMVEELNSDTVSTTYTRAQAQECFTSGAENAMMLGCYKVVQRMEEQASLLDE